MPSDMILEPDKRVPRPMPGKRYMLFPWLEWPIHPFPRSTSLNGLPLANMVFSPTMENASSGVHSAFFVGFDIANIAGLVDVEFLSASNTSLSVFSRSLARGYQR
uniref:Uncharacterized protein n=1 Tax=Lotus japonicus TaxID=34305 RepID=I3S789_LOTJA|nr:unknown [Lotus japonicus]